MTGVLHGPDDPRHGHFRQSITTPLSVLSLQVHAAGVVTHAHEAQLPQRLDSKKPQSPDLLGPCVMSVQKEPVPQAIPPQCEIWVSGRQRPASEASTPPASSGMGAVGELQATQRRPTMWNQRNFTESPGTHRGAAECTGPPRRQCTQPRRSVSNEQSDTVGPSDSWRRRCNRGQEHRPGA